MSVSGYPQGLAFWPGVAQVLSFQMTVGHGIRPSQAVLYMLPQITPPEVSGTLALDYGDGQVHIEFPKCQLDYMSFEIGQDGRRIWGLYIIDRRWMWRFGRISGFYNIRRGKDGDTIILEGTEKRPSELLALCLNAMGETNYDLSQVPDGLRPEVNWDVDNPAQAAANLCDQIGCRLIYDYLYDRVTIQPQGIGGYLPTPPVILGNSLSLNPPETPITLSR